MPHPAGPHSNVTESLRSDRDRTYDVSIKIADPGGFDPNDPEPRPQPAFVNPDEKSVILSPEWEALSGALNR